jgi:phospholipid/cholesterol/gamma-HCH transport system substrate-binding protein
VNRRIAIAGVAAALLVALVVALGAGGDGGDDGTYKVRAIFNNGSYLIPGEDVKVAGAKVGVVDDLEVTDDLRAAAVLRIDEEGFKDFRKDASCEIRIQSLIGEKFIDCKPTEPRPEGTPPPPELAKIPEGRDGAGQRLLPPSQTLTPVGEDQIRDVMRLPYRERFAIILNEFGTGLAARGKDLRKVVRGANPTLRELDKVIAILAKQNHQLARGVTAGDRVLAEWARTRDATADTIVQANIAAQATAERREDLQRNFELFPEFLRQLTPTMEQLGELANEMVPTLANLNPVAADISDIIVALAPFSRAGIPAFQSLGDTADIAGPALVSAEPTIEVLADFTKGARDLALPLQQLLSSVDKTDGFESFMSLILNLNMSVNGYDQFGHYLRTALLAGCNSLATKPNLPCTANFIKGASSGASSARASAAAKTPLERILLGDDPAKALRQYKRQNGGKLQNATSRTQQKSSGAAPAKQRAAKAKPRAKKRAVKPDDAVLDYLMGADG